MLKKVSLTKSVGSVSENLAKKNFQKIKFSNFKDFKLFQF